MSWIDMGRILKIGSSEEFENPPLPTGDERTSQEKFLPLKNGILKNITKLLDLKKVPYSELNGPNWKKKVEDKIRENIESDHSLELSDEQKQKILEELLDEIFGLGPIEDFLIDPDINEIMINGKSDIYVEKKGKITLTGQTFSSDDMILSMLDRILAPLGRRIDTSSPTVDARLKDGSRVHAIIEPLSLIGPVVTIRKFSEKALSMEDLIRLGSLTRELCEFLTKVVKERKNIIVAGGTGTGKTTMLNVLATAIDHSDRIVTIEDSAELKLPQKHTIPLEARPVNIEGKGEVTIRDLVKNALRMRPDRIIVGECRSGEAIDMLQAMNTGHEGCMTTLHANSPRDTLSRLETMVLMSGFDLPVRAIREQIASAIDLIIHLSRTHEGKRVVTSVTEVCGTEDLVITTQELFTLSKDRATGEFSLKATGNIPKSLVSP